MWRDLMCYGQKDDRLNVTPLHDLPSTECWTFEKPLCCEAKVCQWQQMCGGDETLFVPHWHSESSLSGASCSCKAGRPLEGCGAPRLQRPQRAQRHRMGFKEPEVQWGRMTQNQQAALTAGCWCNPVKPMRAESKRRGRLISGKEYADFQREARRWDMSPNITEWKTFNKAGTPKRPAPTLMYDSLVFLLFYAHTAISREQTCWWAGHCMANLFKRLIQALNFHCAAFCFVSFDRNSTQPNKWEMLVVSTLYALLALWLHITGNHFLYVHVGVYTEEIIHL